ncbi:uncharacterized protein LOC112126204 [Cimex lectularius]|uniref:Uncharacterized protein n=1 Tax=Cimex lectularius TaxID=79782 RepID=A0A8I6SRI3_CIMLE|nr:uncharacterized protein LOC112126204 [Cimex lectularius]
MGRLSLPGTERRDSAHDETAGGSGLGDSPTAAPLRTRDSSHDSRHSDWRLKIAEEDGRKDEFHLVRATPPPHFHQPNADDAKSPRLKNIDRSSAQTREITVNNVTVIITEYKPKKKKSSDASSSTSEESQTDTSMDARSIDLATDSRSS